MLWRLAVFCCVISNLLAFTTKEEVLHVTHRERSLQPGEIVILTVKSEHSLEQVEASAFGRTFSFYPGSSRSEWVGLIGIDPDSKAGPCVIDLAAAGSDGRSYKEKYTLEIRARIFPTRRLTVEEKFVTPPKEVEERIRVESRLVERAFATLTPARLWDGSFIVPVLATANSSFGKRTILNGQPRSPHWGTDFNAGSGTPVNSPGSGRVVLAADLYFSGKTIIIDHGLGLFSYLGHLSEISAHEDAEVRKGDPVGKVGATGLVTGPHLHWSVRLAGIRVDPLSLVAVTAGK